MNQEILKKIEKRTNDYDKSLSKYACKNSEAVRLEEEMSDIRAPFYRDIDRIIYSLAYTRYIDKPQVFSYSNDLISKRIIHVQLVSKIARTIARALKLNEDLIEAISLGHDLGHTPFGHFGEKILNEISLKNNQGYFNHNVQSVRLLKEIEHNGRGNNLCLQTLDGIICHNGEVEASCYEPIKKDISYFLREYQLCYSDEKEVTKLIPMTLEGCVVRISDIIAYIGKDVEDAIILNTIKRGDLPKSVVKVLGNNNSSIVNRIILDIINNSYDKPYIKISDDVFKAIGELKKFNYENIYSKAYSLEQQLEITTMFDVMFDFYLKSLTNNKKSSNIFTYFLDYMENDYLENTSKERMVIDYISGMTDNFFMREYELIKGDNNG